VLFGGQGKSQKVYKDLWQYSLETCIWSKAKQDKKCRMPPRLSPATALVKNKLYIFGGATPNPASKKLNDLWTLDLDTGAWEDINTSGDIPSPRASATTVAYNQKVYLYGGTGSKGTSYKLPKLNDLYEYDTVSKSWTKLPTKPDMNGHCYHSMVLRVTSKEGAESASLLLYGGAQYEPSSDTNPLNILTSICFFEYDIDFGAWKRLPNGPPTIKHVAFMSKDGSSMLLWGGLSFCISPSTDVFEFNFERGTWCQLYPTGTRPPSLFSSAVLAHNSIMYLFGGHEHYETEPTQLFYKWYMYLVDAEVPKRPTSGSLGEREIPSINLQFVNEKDDLVT